MTDFVLPGTHKFPRPTADDFAPAPLAAKGNQHQEEIFTAVGQSLSAWAMIEYNISRIYGAILQTRSLAADRSLAALMAFGGRLDVVRAALTVTLTKDGAQTEMRDTVKSFLATAQIASARRNEIAHGHVVGFPLGGGKFDWFLVPQYISPTKHPLPAGEPKYRFNSEIVLRYSDQFHYLAIHMLDLSLRIQRQLPPWQQIPRAPDQPPPQTADSESRGQE